MTEKNTYSIYGTPTCHRCKDAIELAKKYHLEYLYVEFGKGCSMDDFINLFGFRPNSAPIVTLNGNLIGGYEAFKKHLGEF